MEDNCNIFQYSCLKNSMGRGAWQATILGVAKDQTRLSNFLFPAPLASTRQRSRQVSRGSAGEYQADEQAGVARLRWRVSGR